MKKLFTVLCSFTLCLILAACNGASAGLADGVYTISADTDSSMFRVETCQLQVHDGQMSATISLPGEGFSRLYFGSAEDAASAPEAELYDYYQNDAGLYTFDVPVAALDEEIAVAAFGHRRDTWYDHTILFHAPTAGPEPASTTSTSAPDGPTAELKPGEYQIAVTLEGGSGRATVESPTKLVMGEDGTMTAVIVWSSPNYDQMIVGGTQYLPVNTTGNSMFEIPVAALDEDLAVQAETTAMSEPHMIDYTLRFDSGSLQ